MVSLIDIREKINEFENQRLIAIVCIQDNGTFLNYYFDDDDGQISSLTIQIPKGETVESLVDRYPAADYFEREIHDFFGVEFEGNPNLHLMLFLPENWKGNPPMLKE